MPSIFYYTSASGTPVAKWPGKGKSVNGVSRKEGQLYLGRVVNKEQNVFYKRGLGYYRFDTETLECTPIPEDEVPSNDVPAKAHVREPSTIVSFGGPYLLDCLVKGMEYDQVLDAVPFVDRDTLMAMVQYRTLEDRDDCIQELWYKSSYTSFLYPRADVASERVSDTLRSIGTEEARRFFLEAHVRYLAQSTDDQRCVLAYATDRVSARGAAADWMAERVGEAPATISLIVVVVRSTCLPVWYEVVPGDIGDDPAIESVARRLRLYGWPGELDAGDRCPEGAESLVWRLLDDALDHVGMMPERDRTMEAVKGHVLLSFVATFLHAVVEMRMGVAGMRYVAPPRALLDRLSGADGEPFDAELPGGDTQTVLEQDPVTEASGRPADTVFYVVRLWFAKVLDHEIVPAVPTAEALESIEALGLRDPIVAVREGLTLTPLVKTGEVESCTRARVFATRPAVSDKQIEAQRARTEKRRLAEARARVTADQGPKAFAEVAGADGDSQAGATAHSPEAELPKRRPGRPKGSKNKKTLEREAKIERQKAEGTYVEPPKRGRGRPKGSKNKKTLVREATERAALEARGGADVT